METLLSARADLDRVSKIFTETVPGSKCRLWEADAKLICWVGDDYAVRFSRNGLSDEHIRSHANRLLEMLSKPPQ